MANDSFSGCDGCDDAVIHEQVASSIGISIWRWNFHLPCSKNCLCMLTDLLPALGGEQKTEEFFLTLSHMLIDYMNKQLDRSTKV